MSQENIQTNPMDEVKNLITQMKDGFESKISLLENQNKELSSKLENVSTVAQKVDEVSKDVSEYKKTQEEIGVQIKMHDKTLENMALQGAKEQPAKSTSNIGSDYKEIIKKLTNPMDNRVILSPEKSSFVNEDGEIILAKKSISATYNMQLLEPGKNVQAIRDETTDMAYAKVLRYVSLISTNNSLNDIHFPFMNGNNVDSYWEGESINIQETQNITIRNDILKLYAITSKFPTLTHRLFLQMQNGDLPYDIFAKMVRMLELKQQKKIARAVLNGSGSNQPLGLIQDYLNRGVNAGYGKINDVSVSDIGLVENLINLVYSLDDDVLDEGGKLTLFVHRDILNQIDVAKTAMEQTPTRSDTKIDINRIELMAKLKSSLGLDIDVVGLRSEYGLGNTAGTIGAFIGRMSDYVVGSSSISELFTEKLPAQNGYVISRIGYAGGSPVYPKAFSFMSIVS